LRPLHLHTASSSAMFWQAASIVHAACAEVDTRKRKNSSPSCYNCKGERPRPTNYRGCKVAKEEMVTRKIPQAELKNTAGRTIASRLVNASISYAATLMINTQQQRHLGQPKVASGDQQQRNHSVGNAEGNRALNSPLHKDTEVRNASLSSVFLMTSRPVAT